jgi:hypothetical protein
MKLGAWLKWGILIKRADKILGKVFKKVAEEVFAVKYFTTVMKKI